MALQGTLETFSVPEVLRLLSGTGKTGLLALDGDRGRGKVWLEDGAIVEARSDHEQAGNIDAVLFDLLRFDVGDFVFDTEGRADEPGEPVDVDGSLERAESLLGEWQQIQSVVPSMDLGVRLVGELAGESTTVTAQQWTSIVAVGTGTSVAGLGRRLELGELDTCRRVRDLVESSLVELTEDVVEVVDVPEAPAAEPESEPIAEPELVESDLSRDEVATLGSNLASFVANGVADPVPAVDEEPAPFADEPAPFGEEPETYVEEAVPATNGSVWLPEAPTAADEPDDDDFLAQLSSLSPKAAAAIEATADEARPGEPADAGADWTPRDDASPAPEDGPTAAADAESGDEEINRNLLLKFLSSTKN